MLIGIRSDSLDTKEATKKTSVGFGAMVYPNPVIDMICIKLSGKVKNMSITLSDGAGRILWHEADLKSNHFKLSTSQLNPADYIITVDHASERRIVRFTKV